MNFLIQTTYRETWLTFKSRSRCWKTVIISSSLTTNFCSLLFVWNNQTSEKTEINWFNTVKIKLNEKIRQINKYGYKNQTQRIIFWMAESNTT